jgi:diacylglycerol kinase (ATP)
MSMAVVGGKLMSGTRLRIVASTPSIQKQGGRPWAKVLAALKAAEIDYELFATRGPGDAITLARECAMTDCGMMVAAGGDGTIGEVLNGLMQAPAESRPPLAIIPLGRGNDFVRGLPFPKEPHAAVELLTSGKRRRLDVGLLTCQNREGGGERQLYFMNLASIGFAADVTHSVASYGRNLGGTWPYVRGLVTNLAQWRNKPARIEVDGVVHACPIFTINVANGKYYGGGMFAAPGAVLDDGLFDVVVMEGLSLFEVVKYMPNNYNGKFDGIAKIKTMRGRKVSVTTDEPLLVQLDGDVVGITSATFELHAGAVELVI